MGLEAISVRTALAVCAEGGISVASNAADPSETGILQLDIATHVPIMMIMFLSVIVLVNIKVVLFPFIDKQPNDTNMLLGYCEHLVNYLWSLKANAEGHLLT